MGPPAPLPSSSTTMNWLSFSLTPFEMLSSSSPASAAHLNAHHHFLLPPLTFEPTPVPHPPPHYFLDSFYGQGWEDPKHDFLFTELGAVEEDDHVHETKQIAQLQSSALVTSSSVVAPMYPKLEDFLNSSSSSSQGYHPTDATHQDDFSLTQIYDFRDIAAVVVATGGFPAVAALSIHSKSEVDESSNANSSFLTNNGSLTLRARDSTQDENSKDMITAGSGGMGTVRERASALGRVLVFTAALPGESNLLSHILLECLSKQAVDNGESSTSGLPLALIVQILNSWQCHSATSLGISQSKQCTSCATDNLTMATTMFIPGHDLRPDPNGRSSKLRPLKSTFRPSNLSRRTPLCRT